MLAAVAHMLKPLQVSDWMCLHYGLVAKLIAALCLSLDP